MQFPSFATLLATLKRINPMQNNNTPASAVGAAGIKKQTFFNSASTSNTSGNFNVGLDPFYIHAFNLTTGDVVTVEQVGGPGSGTVFTDFAPLGTPITLTPANPQIRVDWPGTYRLVFSGASVTATLVEGFPSASGEPSIYGASPSNGGGAGFALTVTDSTTINLGYAGTTSGGNLTADAIIFPMPPTTMASWTGQVVSAAELSQILFITDDTPRVTNVGVGAGNIVTPTGSDRETCVGYQAGLGTVGAAKVVIGHQAALAIDDFALNSVVVIGPQALVGATPGTIIDGFVAIGHNAGGSTAFQSGVVIGRAAGFNTLANDIVAVGDAAGQNVTGDNNVSVGDSALADSTGSSSVAVGHSALRASSTGDRKTAIGHHAGEIAAASSLSDSIFVGVNAGRGETHVGTIIIASGATDQNASADHQIILGNSTHTELRTAGSNIAGGVISASDARLKDNVTPIVDALGKVARLRPVMFQYDQQALEAAKLPYRPQDCGKPISGFIAQDIEQIMPEVINEAAGSEGKSYKFLHTDRLLGYAFAALQELMAQNTALTERIAALELKGN